MPQTDPLFHLVNCNSSNIVWYIDGQLRKVEWTHVEASSFWFSGTRFFFIALPLKSVKIWDDATNFSNTKLVFTYCSNAASYECFHTPCYPWCRRGHRQPKSGALLFKVGETLTYTRLPDAYNRRSSTCTSILALSQNFELLLEN